MLLVVGVAACGPLVQIGGNAKPPESLLTITATASPRPYVGPSRLAETLAVAVPMVPATLQTLRLPVTSGSGEVRYLVGANWAEQPNRQFQRLLSDTIAAAGTPVLDARQPAVSPARLLSGTLRDFGLDVGGAPVVRVRYDAQLAHPRAPDGQVGIRRFEASEAVADQSPTAVAAALNRAANRVAAEVAEWVKGG
ncbi:hypothetical protein IP88_12310 [alpha proteobacterium AAP81b]|nr:hypothetical protein IP88_12310 [alpha proteobacterium AAP81b]